MSVPAPEATAPAAATTTPAPKAAPVVEATPAPTEGAPKSEEFKSEESKRAVLADLAKERDARKALEARFEKLGEAFGVKSPDGGKTDIEQLTERLTNHESELAKEREARWRAEIANEKGLTPTQAARLKGKTREELTADADVLVADFGITPGKPAAQAVPRPDPAQGARPGVSDIDGEIDEALKKRDFIRVVQLREQKAAASKTKL